MYSAQSTIALRPVRDGLLAEPSGWLVPRIRVTALSARDSPRWSRGSDIVPTSLQRGVVLRRQIRHRADRPQMGVGERSAHPVPLGAGGYASWRMVTPGGF